MEIYTTEIEVLPQYKQHKNAVRFIIPRPAGDIAKSPWISNDNLAKSIMSWSNTEYGKHVIYTFGGIPLIWSPHYLDFVNDFTRMFEKYHECIDDGLFLKPFKDAIGCVTNITNEAAVCYIDQQAYSKYIYTMINDGTLTDFKVRMSAYLIDNSKISVITATLCSDKFDHELN